MRTLAPHHRALKFGVLGVILCVGARAAHAQDANLKATFGSVTLKADFQPDPYLKKLTAGGSLQTTLGGVKAYIEKAPDFKVFYEAGTYPLTIYVESAAVTTLLIHLPDGKWVATNGNGQKPLLEFAKPQSGRYDIWVGTVRKANAPATLKITELKIAAGPGAGQPSENQVLGWFQAAQKLEAQGEHAQAALLFEKVLPEVPRLWKEGSSNHVAVLMNLANTYYLMAQYAKAEPLHLRSLEINQAKMGKDHTDVADCHTNIMSLYLATGQYTKAELHGRRSLEIYEAKLGKDDLMVAAAQNNLANLYIKLGQHARAEPLLLRSLEIREAKLGKHHLEVAVTVYNMARLYTDMSEYAKAEALARRSLEIDEAKLGKDHPKVAFSLGVLAGLYQNLGQYAKAEPLLRRSLEIQEARLGKDHPEVARTLRDSASLYRVMGQSAKAEPLYLRSLEIFEARLGKVHPETASVMRALAGLYRTKRLFDKAEPLYRRSLEIYESTLGNDHSNVATSLNDLGIMYVEMGQFAKAEPLYRRSLAIYEAKDGKDHPNVARSLNNLANLYIDLDQRAKAEPLYLRSLEIREARLGKDHPEVAQSLHNLAKNWAFQKEWSKAVEHIQMARQRTANHVSSVLPILSEQEQLSYLQAKFEVPFVLALSLGFAAGKQAAAPSAEWLLNGKAIAHQSLAEQSILARDAKDPKARQLVEDLQNTRARLAALINRLPMPGREKEHLQEMQELKGHEQDLAQKLARAVGRPYRANPWITLDELRARLGPKTAFVDIARFELWDYSISDSKGFRYVAWITPPQGKGDVQLIDLGEAEPVDKLVADTRKVLIESAKAITKVGEVEAWETVQKPLKELSARVLHPLLPALEKYEEWIICPDGALWLTPWNALLLKDEQFSVEKHVIRHVVSGRDLVLDLPKVKAESAYIFADPDYDLSPTKVMAASGLRGLTSPLLGQRLRGSIGAWNVSFEFLDKEVVIYDEDGKGSVAGKGTWKHDAGALTIQTGISQFQGTRADDEIRGQRSMRNPNGTVTRDTFRINLPSEETRSINTAAKTLPRVPRLPGTAVEAEAIRPKLKQWLGQEPNVFLEERASEAMVRAVKNPRVLTLATHGYFLPTQEVDVKDRPGADLGEGKGTAPVVDKKGQSIENPLLRCGLLLAGCNKRTETRPGEDDGILTGLEIVGMNLQGCELVVLSACETGLGDVRSGEGVAGLRQAFQLAGAKSVLASLWQVPDRETAFLMNAFYGELTKGKSQAQSLRQAQLQRIAARAPGFGAAHPFFWSAFTLTSRGTD